MWVGFCIMWLSMAFSVAVGIAETGHWWLLFFMLIPAFMDYPNKPPREKKEKEGKKDEKDGEHGTDTLSAR